MKIGIRKNVYDLVNIQLIDILLINIIINFKINYQIKIPTIPHNLFKSFRCFQEREKSKHKH